MSHKSLLFWWAFGRNVVTRGNLSGSDHLVLHGDSQELWAVKELRGVLEFANVEKKFVPCPSQRRKA